MESSIIDLTINDNYLTFYDKESEVSILEMKGLTKAVTIIAKIMEVCSWVGAALVAASLVAIAAGQNRMLKYFSSIQSETELSIGGFSIDMDSVDPAQTMRAYAVFFILVFISCVLMAVVFRNTYLIFKTAQGKTKFSKGCTPFQPQIVRMIREIGILTLCVPVIQLVMSIVARLMLTPHGSEIAVSLDLSPVFFGLVVLCLSQLFAYGAELQEDADGLL